MSDNTVEFSFVVTNPENGEEEEKDVKVEKGLSILDAARHHDIDLEGACEGSLACSTCHVILEKQLYDSLEKPSEEEEDMLDLAFGLTETSRLGCQVYIDENFSKNKVCLPKNTRNIH